MNWPRRAITHSSVALMYSCGCLFKHHSTEMVAAADAAAVLLLCKQGHTWFPHAQESLSSIWWLFWIDLAAARLDLCQ
jgi:hypothetical protein